MYAGPSLSTCHVRFLYRATNRACDTHCTNYRHDAQQASLNDRSPVAYIYDLRVKTVVPLRASKHCDADSTQYFNANERYFNH